MMACKSMTMVIGAWTLAAAGAESATRGAEVQPVGTFDAKHLIAAPRVFLLDIQLSFLYTKVCPHAKMATTAPMIVPALKRHTATVIVAHGLGDSGAGWYTFNVAEQSPKC